MDEVRNDILPGTPGGDALATLKHRQERTVLEGMTDAVNSSAAASVWRNVTRAFDNAEEQDPEFGKGALGVVDRLSVGVPALFGNTGGAEEDWDKEAYYSELTDDLPVEYRDGIMAYGSLEEARFAKNKIMDSLDRSRRMGMDVGLVAAASGVASMADLDLPLALMTGGGWSGVKVAGKTLYAAAKLGVKPGLALRASAIAAGAAGGLEAGLVVGGAQALAEDTVDWQDAVNVALTTTVLGAGIGAALPKWVLPLKEVNRDFMRRAAAGDPKVWGPLDQRAGVGQPSADAPQAFREAAEAAANPEAAAKPLVIEDASETAPTQAGEPAPDVPEFRSPGESLSAAAVQGPPIFPALNDPAGRMNPSTVQTITAARQWSYSTNFAAKRQQGMRATLAKLSLSPVFNIGTNNVAKLVKSSASVAHFLVGAIFEVPSGVVRGDTASAAIVRTMYLGRLQTIMSEGKGLAQKWAQETGQHYAQVAGKKFGISRQGNSDFNRAVYLHMNDLALTGKMQPPRNRADAIAQAQAAIYARNGEEALTIAKGMPGDIPLGGAANLPAKSAYIPYKHDGRKMLKLIDDGEITLPELKSAYADAYLSAGTFTDRQLAESVADAVVTRAVARATQNDESMIMLFSDDGRDFLETTLRGNGLSAQEVDAIMSRFTAEMQERGKLSTMKMRNELDFGTPIALKSGLQINLVDLMDSDLETVFTRYNREIAGASALARKGITSKAQRTDIANALNAEKRALGEEEYDANVLSAMWSEFDGGPQRGAGIVHSETNNGIGALAELKSLASLSLLTFNGFAQLAETGPQIAAVGLSNWYARGIGAQVDAALKADNLSALQEFAPFFGQTGNDQNLFKPHLAVDESLDYGSKQGIVADTLRGARHWLNQGNMIQGYTSLLNFVRGEQQKIAALAMADKVVRKAMEGRATGNYSMQAFDTGRMMQDLALDEQQANAIADLVEAGVIEVKTIQTKIGPVTYVNRFNFDQWDQTLANDFAASIVRSMGQQVQRAMAGESDRWMHTGWGAMITHLQTYPILAIQKQFMRNAMQADGEAAAQAAFGLATAYAAISIRDAVTGNERTPEEKARAAFGYSNLMGWIPLYTDPMASMIGQDSLRIGQFGPFAKPLSIPTADVVNNLVRAGGAAVNTVRGKAEYHDEQALRAVPFFRLIEAAQNMAGFGGDAGKLEVPKPKKSEKDNELEELKAMALEAAGS